jgi:hypothetical protein
MTTTLPLVRVEAENELVAADEAESVRVEKWQKTDCMWCALTDDKRGLSNGVLGTRKRWWYVFFTSGNPDRVWSRLSKWKRWRRRLYYLPPHQVREREREGKKEGTVVMHLKKEIATAVAAAATFSLSLSPYLSFTANGLILSWRRRNCLLAWRTSRFLSSPPARL